MRLEQRQVSTALRPWVRSLWAFEGEFSHLLERVLPTGLAQLIINLHANETHTYASADPKTGTTGGGIVVQGPHDRPFTIDTIEQRNVLGVVFRPGALHGALGAPSTAVFNQHVDLDELWGHDSSGGHRANELRERLLATPVSQRLRVLDDLLVARFTREARPCPVVASAVAALEHGARVGRVVEQVGWAHKRFTRTFRDAVGLTPKRFAAVRRFSNMLSTARDVHLRQDAIQWAALAAECGYSDQSHLIADFRRFAGFTPSRYAPRDASAPSHVVL